MPAFLAMSIYSLPKVFSGFPLTLNLSHQGRGDLRKELLAVPITFIWRPGQQPRQTEKIVTEYF
jgi:hypothetical protein